VCCYNLQNQPRAATEPKNPTPPSVPAALKLQIAYQQRLARQTHAAQLAAKSTVFDLHGWIVWRQRQLLHTGTSTWKTQPQVGFHDCRQAHFVSQANLVVALHHYNAVLTLSYAIGNSGCALHVRGRKRAPAAFECFRASLAVAQTLAYPWRESSSAPSARCLSACTSCFC
jgi:hypothetical protein